MVSQRSKAGTLLTIVLACILYSAIDPATDLACVLIIDRLLVWTQRDLLLDPGVLGQRELLLCATQCNCVEDDAHTTKSDLWVLLRLECYKLFKGLVEWCNLQELQNACIDQLLLS